MKRTLSRALGAPAYLLPPTWAYFVIQTEAQAQREAQGFVCGNPMLAIVTLACVASATLSICATGLGALDYMKLPSPRPMVRTTELVLLAVPSLVASAIAATTIGPLIWP